MATELLIKVTAMGNHHISSREAGIDLTLVKGKGGATGLGAAEPLGLFVKVTGEASGLVIGTSVRCSASQTQVCAHRLAG
jgi:hypothetical protein